MGVSPPPPTPEKKEVWICVGRCLPVFGVLVFVVLVRLGQAPEGGWGSAHIPWRGVPIVLTFQALGEMKL